MGPEEFEHVVAAAAEITGQDELVVIGSQAILGSHPHPPEAMLHSLEADIYPLHEPHAADLIDGRSVTALSSTSPTAITLTALVPRRRRHRAVGRSG